VIFPFLPMCQRMGRPAFLLFFFSLAENCDRLRTPYTCIDEKKHVLPSFPPPTKASNLRLFFFFSRWFFSPLFWRTASKKECGLLFPSPPFPTKKNASSRSASAHGRRCCGALMISFFFSNSSPVFQTSGRERLYLFFPLLPDPTLPVRKNALHGPPSFPFFLQTLPLCMSPKSLPFPFFFIVDRE